MSKIWIHKGVRSKRHRIFQSLIFITAWIKVLQKIIKKTALTTYNINSKKWAELYRKLPLSSTGDALKKPDVTLLVTAHRVFWQSSLLFFILNLMTESGYLRENFIKKSNFIKKKFSNFVNWLFVSLLYGKMNGLIRSNSHIVLSYCHEI